MLSRRRCTITGSCRFEIAFDPLYRVVSSALLLFPSDSYIEVGDDVVVRMGWAFRASFDRRRVVRTAPFRSNPMSRGVHGWSGKWLVNGSGSGILAIELQPAQRAYVMGFPVPLQELLVSVESPTELAAALAG